MHNASDVYPFIIAMDIFGHGPEACGLTVSEKYE
jgi:hypothetical protein